MKLYLGTANWGRAYGVSQGCIQEKEAHELMDLILEKGQPHIDTALAYGQAHSYIRSYRNKDKLNIQTKFHSSIPLDDIKKALDNLDTKIESVLLHNLSLEKIDTYVRLFEDRDIDFGFSLNSLTDFQNIQKCVNLLSIVQLPYNLVDRRWQRYFEYFMDNSVRIQLRSAYLQGELLIQGGEVFKDYQPIYDYLNLWKSRFAINERVRQCVDFQRLADLPHSAVYGVDGIQQLNTLIGIFESSIQDVHFSDQNFTDERTLLPMNW